MSSGGRFRSVLGLAWLLAVVGAQAQDVPPTQPGKRQYSPYPEQNFPNRVYFGDTHLHTSYSTDAGMIGNTLGPGGGVSIRAGRDGHIEHRPAARSCGGRSTSWSSPTTPRTSGSRRRSSRATRSC